MSPVDHLPFYGASPLSRYGGIYLGSRSPAALKSDDSDVVSTESCGKSDISSEGFAPSEGTKSSDPGYHTAKDLNISDTRHLYLNVLSLNMLHDILTHPLAIAKQAKGEVFIAASGGYEFIIKTHSKRSYLAQELRAYSLLRRLQGHQVPICYDVFSTMTDNPKM